MIWILASCKFTVKSWAISSLQPGPATLIELANRIGHSRPDPNHSVSHGPQSGFIAETIKAPADKVFPWPIQIGDPRGAFYSYTFIEKIFDPMQYNNTDRIHPEWQTPDKGQGVIADMLVIRDYQPGSWVLAKETPKFGGLQWTWMRLVEPIDGAHSRLINRMRAGTPGANGNNPAIIFFLNAGGFVME